MEFAERMLKKHGWDPEKGLGKNNQGMKTALKPVLKFDTRGVGCNQKDEYSSEFKWWEYTYNRAAKKVSDSLDQPEGEQKKEKKRKHKEDDEEKSTKKSIYTRFQKSSVLMDNKEESVRLEKELASSVLMDNKEESVRLEKELAVTETNTPTPSDEDLLRICGGRTAHKGARHGIKMGGKLQRLQEQEDRALSSSCDNSLEKKKKKKRKSIEQIDE
ncbi:unnamed protein product [Adineta steineri]|uniref:G patch domain-containing protein 4 n=1 Tax=Adineta steineri TaxID=433720 RepID=A0A815LMF2_9BILA|nr:unnamed protein product [Adineta steineri]